MIGTAIAITSILTVLTIIIMIARKKPSFRKQLNQKLIIKYNIRASDLQTNRYSAGLPKEEGWNLNPPPDEIPRKKL